MIKIAVIEDQIKWSSLIKSYLEKYQKDNDIQFDISFFTDGSDFIEDYKGEYNLIFMDVAMPKMNGIEASKKLRKIDKDVCLVFLTEMAQYALEGYEVNAYDFLIKPMEYELFSIKLNKFLSYIKINEDKYFIINSSNEIHKVKYSEILYVESIKHYVYFHCLEDTYRMRLSLDSIKKDLKANHFSEINRSLIVNLSHVDNYSNNDVCVKGENLPLSRAYKTSFLSELMNYFGDKL